MSTPTCDRNAPNVGNIVRTATIFLIADWISEAFSEIPGPV